MTRTLSFAGNALFGLVALVIAGGILALTVLPPVLHYQTYVVLSGSMEPAIHTGSVVVAMATPPQALRIGDVVTYVRQGDEENVTHRISGITSGPQGLMFTTKGDANGAADLQEIRFDRLAGKVTVTVPYLGYFFKFVGSPSMRFLFIVVPGLLLLGSWLWEVWRPEPKLKPPAEEAAPGLIPAAAAAPSVSLAKTEVTQSLAAADAAAVPLRQ